MFHWQDWAARLPTSLFEQTQYETDQVFYATFPAARHAARTAALAQNLYDPTSSTDCSALYDGVQSLDNDISTSLPFGGATQQLPPHFNYSQQLSPYHYQDPPCYCPPPIKNDATVYIPSEQPYYHQYSPESISSDITQSSSTSVSNRESTVSQLLNTGSPPNVNTKLEETISDGCSLDSPQLNFRQLNRHMKPPTLKFTNNCQLAVMRLDRLLEDSHLDLSKHEGQSYASSSKIQHVPSSYRIAPTPTEFLLSSPKSPSIGLSSLPSKNVPERKPPLACLFCRGRKIACGPPLPGSAKKTCNQCRKRSLHCQYPSESRRGMRKKKPPSTTNTNAATNIK